MRLISGMKDDKNQFDLSELCKIVTKEEPQPEERSLLKVSKSVAIVARLNFK